MDALIDKKDATPVFRQLAQQLKKQIASGIYPPSSRLPTIQALAQLATVSVGTAKAAYDLLEQQGYAKKVQGSGIYATHPAQPAPLGSLEEQAEALFSLCRAKGVPVGVGILLLERKLCQLAGKEPAGCVALADCNWETLRATAAQLAQLERVTVLPYLVEELLAGAVVIDPRCHLLLTTQPHVWQLCGYADRVGLPLVEFHLTVSSETVEALAKVPKNRPVCLLYQSDSFAENVQETLKQFGIEMQLICAQEDALGQAALLCCARGDPFVVPADFQQNSTIAAQQLVKRASDGGSQIVPFRYQMDVGSLLQVREQLRQTKKGVQG